jgi:Spy/CpxP family protein refolding chaperone
MIVTARTAALSIVLSCVAGATAAWAQPPGAPGARPAPPATGQSGARLPPPAPPEGVPSLSAAQREQLAALRQQTRQQLAPQRERLRAKRLELRALWLAEPPSEAAIVKKIAEIDAIRAAMRPPLVKSRLASLALLTHAQREALARPARPHDCPHRSRHMHGGPGHDTGAPPRQGAIPWLEEGVDDGLDDDGILELDPMQCPSHSPAPPRGAKHEGH